MSPSQPRTYWHLAAQKKVPNAYDIASSKLLYYTQSGFEVAVPMAAWYARYQQGSRLQCADWEKFRDPRETTYTRYVELQKSQEEHVEQLLLTLPQLSAAVSEDAAWRAQLDATLPQLRFVYHGLQMVAAYVGQMAPASRITIAAALQAADELRLVQCFAYLMRYFQSVDADFGRESRAVWLESPAWQGLRRLVEELLVTYDWGEALVALNLVVKPGLNELIFKGFLQRCWKRGESVLAAVLLSLARDADWHMAWSEALVSLVRVDQGDAAAFVEEVRQRWQVSTEAALEPLRILFLEEGGWKATRCGEDHDQAKG